jgi:hypothetical protein
MFDDDDDDNGFGKKILPSLSPWAYCKKHDVHYPSNEECPKCREERESSD